MKIQLLIITLALLNNFSFGQDDSYFLHSSNFKRFNKLVEHFIDSTQGYTIPDEKSLSKNQLLEFNNLVDSAITAYQNLYNYDSIIAKKYHRENNIRLLKSYRYVVNKLHNKTSKAPIDLGLYNQQKLTNTIEQAKKGSIIHCSDFYDYIFFTYYAMQYASKKDLIVVHSRDFSSVSGIHRLSKKYGLKPLLNDSCLAKSVNRTFEFRNYTESKSTLIEIIESIDKIEPKYYDDLRRPLPLNLNGSIDFIYQNSTLVLSYNSIGFNVLYKFYFVEQMNRPFIRLDKPSYKEVNYESGLFSFHLMPNSESTSNIDQLIIKQLISYKCVETSKKSNYNNLNEIYLDYIVRNPGNKTLFDSHWTNFSLEFRPFGYRFYYPKLIPVLIKNSKVDEAIQLSKTCRFSAGNMSYVLSHQFIQPYFNAVYNAIASNNSSAARSIYVYESNSLYGLRTKDSVLISASYESYALKDLDKYGNNVSFVLTASNGSQLNYDKCILPSQQNYSKEETVFMPFSESETEYLDLVEHVIEEEAKPQEANTIYDFVEISPEFPGGVEELYLFISKKLKPVNTGGKVYLSFVINKDGSLSDAKVMKGVNPAADKEALRVVKLMPNWIPGKQMGEAVNCRYNLPIVVK
ncbi:MAG: protein TonB [Flavobacteriales bacterium]|jgi:protein TonB